MVEPEGQEPDYAVHYSEAIARRLEKLQRRAARQGRGVQMLAALKRIYQQLQRNPRKLGEPLYRLSGMNLEIRTVSVRPVAIVFAVHEDRPLVFISRVQLLSP